MDSEQFKTAVKEFAELSDELTEASKAVRELRKRKLELGEEILEIMRTEDIDELQLADGKLVRRQAKRTEPLTREKIQTHLRKSLPATDADNAVENMYGAREIVVKDALSRRKK